MDGGTILVRMQLTNRCMIQEIEASRDMDVSMDIHVKSADMDAKFYIHGQPGFCNFLP